MVPREHGRASGAIAFIHAFVVRTAQSYVTAVPSGAAKSLNVPVPSSPPSARAWIRFGFDVDDGDRELDRVRDLRAPGVLVDRPLAVALAVEELPPARRRATIPASVDRVDRVPDALDRRVDGTQVVRKR